MMKLVQKDSGYYTTKPWLKSVQELPVIMATNTDIDHFSF